MSSRFRSEWTSIVGTVSGRAARRRSIVSRVSVAWPSSVGWSGPQRGRFMT